MDSTVKEGRFQGGKGGHGSSLNEFLSMRFGNSFCDKNHFFAYTKNNINRRSNFSCILVLYTLTSWKSFKALKIFYQTEQFFSKEDTHLKRSGFRFHALLIIILIW